MTALRRTLLLALAALVAALGTPGMARGQLPGPRPATDPLLRVETLRNVLTDDVPLHATVAVRNRADAVLDGLRLVVTVHRRVADRAAFSAAMVGEDLGPVWTSVALPVTDQPPQTVRLVEITATAAELDLQDPVEHVGVYPVQLQLFDDGEPAAEALTSLVYAPRPVEQPLRVSTLVTLDAPPAQLADGSVDPAAAAQLAPRSRLDRLARELESYTQAGSGAGLVVALDGRLVADAADIADGYRTPDGAVVAPQRRAARHAAAFARRVTGVTRRADVQLLATPYGPADLVALVRGGLHELATRLIAEGPAAVERHTGQAAPQRVLLPPDGIDRDTLATTLTAGVDTVVLDPGASLAAPAPGTPSPVQRLRSPAGGDVTGMLPDQRLSALLDAAEGTPALVAARVVAETAVVWQEDPDRGRRGLLLATPRRWDPQPGLLLEVLRRLAEAPWVRPVALTELARTVRAPEGTAQLAYPAAAQRRELPPAYVTRLGRALEAIEPLAALLPLDDATPDAIARDLLVAASVHFRHPDRAADGLERVDVPLRRLRALSSAVQVLDAPPITLTAATGQLPVTLLNRAGVPLRVRVSVVSSGFSFEGGEERSLVLPPGEPTTVTFPARALSPGSLAPVVVSVEDAEGLRSLTAGTLAVRSTAVPLVGLLVTAGGGVFLLAWWWRDARRRAAARQPRDRRAAA